MSASAGRKRLQAQVVVRILGILVLLCSFAAVGLGVWKTRLNRSEIQQTQALWRSVGGVASSLFDGAFYFSREEGYDPEIRKLFDENPELLAVQHVDPAGRIVHREESRPIATPPQDWGSVAPELLKQIQSGLPGVRTETGFRFVWVFPGEASSLVLETRALSTAWIVLGGLAFILVVLTAGVAVIALRPDWFQRLLVDDQKASSLATVQSFSRFAWKAWPLWLKVFSLVLLVNFLTGLVLFESLSRWQSTDLGARIQREATLLARFSNPKLIADFRAHFYDPSASAIFRKSVSEIIAVNTDLERIRVISRKTGAVLFTSDLIDAESGGVPLGVVEPVKFGAELSARVSQDGFAVEGESQSVGKTFRVVVDGGQPDGASNALDEILRSKVSEESLYWVEYRFGLRSLAAGIEKVRRELLLNLLPVLLISVALALALARFLSEPIRQLIGALRGIGQGDLSTKVAVTRGDEIGELEKAFNTMIEELRRKQELKKYLSDATYRQIVEASESGRPQGESGARKLEAAVLFSDIRGFVTHCETSEAEEVLQMLNEYFAEMVTAIYAHGGEVDKFIGDAVLAVFYIRDEDSGEGMEGSGSCLRAIQAALEMKARLESFNERRRSKKKFTIDIGIGISFGRVISGEMGTRDRRDFTVIGDAVNVASRIEKFSKKGRGTKVVFSGGVEDRVRGLVGYDLLEEAPVAGKEERIRVCELTEIRELGSLIHLLSSSDPKVRTQALGLLALSRSQDSVEPLLQHLQDESESVRSAAARGIGILPISALPATLSERLVDRLIARLDEEPSRKVLSSLVLAIGKVCTDLRILRLESFLVVEGEDRLVADAVEAMGALAPRFPEVQDRLIPLLSSRSNRVRANAAKSLFLAGRHEVIDSLTPMLLNSNPLMRASGAWAMGELAAALPMDSPWLIEGLFSQKRLESAVLSESGSGDRLLDPAERTRQFARFKPLLAALQASVPMLVALLKDSDERVRRQSISALGKIQDRSALMPLIESIDFQRDSRETLLEISQALRSIGAHRLVREVVDRLT